MHSTPLDAEGSFSNRKGNSNNQKYWYIFYTSPRAEKVVYKELQSKNYDVFLPTVKTLSVWKNRQKKMIDRILFPSYIFVNTQQHELFNIVRTPKVATYIHCGGKPSVVNPNEIEGIKKMLSLNADITVETNFSEGEKVRILSGPLIGYEGMLINQQGKKKFGIQLKEINHTVMIDLTATEVEKIKTSYSKELQI